MAEGDRVGLGSTRPDEICQCASNDGEIDPPSNGECHRYCPACHEPIKTTCFDAHMREVHDAELCSTCGFHHGPSLRTHPCCAGGA